MSDMELQEHLVTLAQVPALVVAAEPPAAAAERGTVLVLHGLTASKETQRTEAHSLAERGYLAVAIDAVGHGARRYRDFEARFSAEHGERSFFDVVQRTADELPSVLDALARLGWTRPGCIGACGFSMGGFILLGAMSSRCAFDAVATVVASPRWLHVPESPHERLDRFFPTPLLMQTAGDDLVVSPSAARELHGALTPRYDSAPERLRYVEYPGEDHMVSEPTWRLAWNEILTWFARFLRG